MLKLNIDQQLQVVEVLNQHLTFPIAIEAQPDQKENQLLADLSPDMPWETRKIAAQKLGDQQSPKALQGLVDALRTDPFWMVRCAIIQALERIGDPSVIATLQEVAKADSFQIVRSYAAKANERLSQVGKEPI